MKAGLRVSLLVLLLQAAGAAESRFAIDMLAAHNAVRASLKIRPLTWSDKLAARAQDWADNLLARDQFSHRPKSEYGENLFTITGAPATPEQVVAAWAAESQDYDYRSNQCRKICGHYTQLVWKDTRRVGCAVARNGRREVWVCNYDPRGNYFGERPY